MATQISGVICVEEFNENKDKGPTESKSHNHTRGIRLERMLHREYLLYRLMVSTVLNNASNASFQCFIVPDI